MGIIKYEFSGDGDATEAYIGYSISGFDLAYAQDLDESDNEFFSVSYGLPSVVEGVDASLTYGDVTKKKATDSYDYMQLDVSYGDLTITLVDDDAIGTTAALSYSWSL